MSTDKTDFLVVYDYSTGGVWAIVCARSSMEIALKYPVFTVIEQRPSWMTDEYYDHLKHVRYIDIDSEPTGWFKNLLSP
jgi:hypothetical protein